MLATGVRQLLLAGNLPVVAGWGLSVVAGSRVCQLLVCGLVLAVGFASWCWVGVG